MLLFCVNIVNRTVLNGKNAVTFKIKRKFMTLKERQKSIKTVIITIVFATLVFVTPLSTAFAQSIPSVTGGGGCEGCGPCDCMEDITEVHENVREHVTDGFEAYREWLVEEFFREAKIPEAMMLMAKQLTAGGIQQIQIIGTFFDAKHQLETQRIFQTLVAKAHKDYHPSESMCEIGTTTRALATSERIANLNKVAFANRMMARQLLSEDTVSGQGIKSDRESRLKQFRTVFCNPADNTGGLDLLCGSGGVPAQYNMDVDYTNTIENKLTLDIDFYENPKDTTPDEQNVFALSANLFGHEVLSYMSDRILANPDFTPNDRSHFYIKQRAIAAKRSVAQNSFAAITAMRGQGSGENDPFLKTIIKNLGVAEAEINAYIGESPSYFAQMEILTKKLYQDPKFYAELYDKPANVERKAAALQAIGIMQDRDIYNSLLRSETVLATLLETLMSKEHTRVSADLSSLKDKGEK